MLLATLALTPADVHGQDEHGHLETLEVYEDAESRQAHFEADPLQPVLAPWERHRDRLEARWGLDYGFVWTPIVQVGSQDEKRTTVGHEIDFVGEWRVVESDRWGRGALQWWGVHYLTVGPNTASDFSGDGVGSSYVLNDIDTAPGKNQNEIGTFWWQQLLLDERLEVIAGKVDAGELLLDRSYTGDGTIAFLSEALSADPVLPMFDEAGLGLYLAYRGEDWYVSGLVRDAEADKRAFDFSHLDRTNFYYALEVGVTPDVPGLGAGAWRLSYYHHDRTEDTESSGYAYTVSLEQDLADRLAVFLLLSSAARQRNDLKSTLSVGLMWLRPFGYAHDLAGVAATWANPSGEEPENERDEYGLEAFWRLQLLHRVEFTPDVQLIFNPSRGGSDFRVVGGLRLRVVF